MQAQDSFTRPYIHNNGSSKTHMEYQAKEESPMVRFLRAKLHEQPTTSHHSSRSIPLPSVTVAPAEFYQDANGCHFEDDRKRSPSRSSSYHCPSRNEHNQQIEQAKARSCWMPKNAQPTYDDDDMSVGSFTIECANDTNNFGYNDHDDSDELGPMMEPLIDWTIPFSSPRTNPISMADDSTMTYAQNALFVPENVDPNFPVRPDGYTGVEDDDTCSHNESFNSIERLHDCMDRSEQTRLLLFGLRVQSQGSEHTF